MGSGARCDCKPAGEWNTYEIRASGKTLTLWVNGAVESEFTSCEVPRGYVGLETEGYRMEFRNVKLKVLHWSRMDAKPALLEIGRQLKRVGLEAVLVGNAGAALQGAPVTTVDFDFLFRRSERNLAKLKAFAAGLGAVVLRPYYPVSDLYRVVRDDDGLQVDFMGTIHGLRSFEGVRDRAAAIVIDDVTILVASLADIIRSKRAAGRPRDKAVLELLEKALGETTRSSRKARRPPQGE